MFTIALKTFSGSCPNYCSEIDKCFCTIFVEHMLQNKGFYPLILQSLQKHSVGHVQTIAMRFRSVFSPCVGRKNVAKQRFLSINSVHNRFRNIQWVMSKLLQGDLEVFLFTMFLVEKMLQNKDDFP